MLDRSSQHERERQAGRCAERCQRESASKDRRKHVSRRSAERHADADLACLLQDDMREHAVETKRGKDERDPRESDQEGASEPALPDPVRDATLVRRDIEK